MLRAAYSCRVPLEVASRRKFASAVTAFTVAAGALCLRGAVRVRRRHRPGPAR